MTVDFLTTVYGHGSGWVHLSTTNRILTAMPCSNVADLFDSIDGASNVYLSAAVIGTDRGSGNNGRIKDRDASELTALWVDLDRAGEPGHKTSEPLWAREDIQKLWDDLPAKPTAVVDSGGGWWFYYVLENPVPLNEDGSGELLLARWARWWEQNGVKHGRQIDSVFNPGRICRAPGSINNKDDQPRLAKVTSLNSDRRYSTAELDQILPAPEPAPTSQNAAVQNDRPGDHYNKDATVSTITELLERHGFHSPKAKGQRVDLTRPGKKRSDGHSVTVWPDATVTFWSSTAEGQPGTVELRDQNGASGTYDPFGVYSALEHAGDHQAAARKLSPAATLKLPKQVDIHNNQAPVEPPDAEYTDSWNSWWLAQLEGDNIRYVHAWGKWIVWTGNHWEVDSGNALIADAAKAVARRHAEDWGKNNNNMTVGEANQLANWAKQSFNRSRIEAMVYLARGVDGVLIDHNSLDSNPDMLDVANGRIDLKIGQHQPSDPTHLNTKMSPVRYDPDAAAPTWQRSLEQWHPDPEQRAYLQRLVGEAVVGTVRDHLLCIHFGGGANGKGTFVNALANVFGNYFTVPHKSLLTVTYHEQHATIVASLFRARLAIASETEKRVKLNEAIVKNLTGGDTLRARRMREDEWSFEPTHSLWLQTNHLPEIAGTDEGIWRRVRVIPWVASFEGNKGDLRLGEKLRAEAPGILNWVIQGALDWQEHGLEAPPSVIEATDEYRKAEDKVARFLTEYDYQLGDDLHVRAAIIQNEWAEWTEAVFGQKGRGNELAEGLHQRRATSNTTRVTEGAARKTVTVWRGVGKHEKQHAK